MKGMNKRSFSEITMPLKEAAKISRIKEQDVVDIIHRFRKNKKQSKMILLKDLKNC